MAANTFHIVGVPAVLSRDVDCLIVNEFSGTEGTAIHVFPSAVPQIVFHYNKGQPAIENIQTPSKCVSSPPTLFLCGAGTESSVMRFGKGSYSVIQVILKSHALKSLLGLNALTLHERPVELNEFSMEDIHEQMVNARGAPEQAALLTGFLVSHLKKSATRDELVEQSLRLIHCNAGAISVKRLVQMLHISERQFERRFCQTVGISPSSYIRVRRFNEAIRLMQTGQYNTLTDIAYALHFHDQSHFIRDIKAFTGITPTSLSQKVDDFFQNQAGYSYS
jgi:AraC-like DNA-binding protein